MSFMRNIQDLRSAGLDYLTLDQALTYEQPTSYLVKSTSYENGLPTPVLTAGQTFILGYTAETQGVYMASEQNPVIIFDDFTTAFKWVDFPFKVKSSAMKMLRLRDPSKFRLRFIYYWMQTCRFSPTQHVRHWISQYSKLAIPLVPLDVQDDVISRLDKLASLGQALEAELKLRQKQLEALLDLFYGDIDSGQPFDELGSVGVFIRGNGMLKDTLKNEGMPAIHYGQVHTLYGTATSETQSFVDPSYGIKLRQANPGDVILATTAEDIQGVAKPCAWLGSVPAAVSGDAYIFRTTLDPLFAAYFFKSRTFQNQKALLVTGTKVKRISGEMLSKVRIPMRTSQKQEEIGKALASVESLMSDANHGLEAELRLRKDQFAYYRDSLLTFERA